MLRHAWAASICLLYSNIRRAVPLSFDIVARIGAIIRCVRLSLAARRAAEC